jgi:hypothetical protein
MEITVNNQNKEASGVGWSIKFRYGVAFTATMLAASLLFLGLTAQAGGSNQTTTLVDVVREATQGFKDPEDAGAAGYGLFHGCVSGPEEGAMGIHYANGNLVGDGTLDAMKPEALLYEANKNGQLRLTAVEYVVLAAAWDAGHDAPPVLMGQLFHYVGSPNRYGLPAFYQLHVWAMKQNPLGTFADWNPKVVCDHYTSDATHSSAH